MYGSGIESSSLGFQVQVVFNVHSFRTGICRNLLQYRDGPWASFMLRNFISPVVDRGLDRVFSHQPSMTVHALCLGLVVDG